MRGCVRLAGRARSYDRLHRLQKTKANLVESRKQGNIILQTNVFMGRITLYIGSYNWLQALDSI